MIIFARWPFDKERSKSIYFDPNPATRQHHSQITLIAVLVPLLRLRVAASAFGR